MDYQDDRVLVNHAAGIIKIHNSYVDKYSEKIKTVEFANFTSATDVTYEYYGRYLELGGILYRGRVYEIPNNGLLVSPRVVYKYDDFNPMEGIMLNGAEIDFDDVDNDHDYIMEKLYPIHFVKILNKNYTVIGYGPNYHLLVKGQFTSTDNSLVVKSTTTGIEYVMHEVIVDELDGRYDTVLSDGYGVIGSEVWDKIDIGKGICPICNSNDSSKCKIYTHGKLQVATCSEGQVKLLQQ